MANWKTLDRDRMEHSRGCDQDGDINDHDCNPSSSPTSPLAFNGSPVRRSSDYVRSQSLNGRIQKPNVVRSQSFNGKSAKLPHRSHHMDTLQAQLMYMKAHGVDQKKFVNVLEKLKDMYLSQGDQQQLQQQQRQQQEDRRTGSKSSSMPSSPLSSSQTFSPRVEDRPAEASTIALLQNKFAQLERYKESIQGQQIQVYPGQNFHSGHSSAQRTPASSTPCSPRVGTDDSYYFDEGTTALLALQQEMMANSSRSAASSGISGSDTLSYSQESSGTYRNALNSPESTGTYRSPLSSQESMGPYRSPLNSQESMGPYRSPLNSQEPRGTYRSPLNSQESMGIYRIPLNSQESMGTYRSPMNSQESMGSRSPGGWSACDSPEVSCSMSPQASEAANALLLNYMLQPPNVGRPPHSNLHAFQNMSLASGPAAAVMGSAGSEGTAPPDSLGGLLAAERMEILMEKKAGAGPELHHVPTETKLASSIQQVVAKFPFNLTAKFSLPKSKLQGAWGRSLSLNPPIVPTTPDCSEEPSWESDSSPSTTYCSSGPDVQWYNSSGRECSNDMHMKQQELIDTSLHL